MKKHVLLIISSLLSLCLVAGHNENLGVFFNPPSTESAQVIEFNKEIDAFNLELADIYKNIELTPVKLPGHERDVHLYPNEKIYNLYKEYRGLRPKYDSFLSYLIGEKKDNDIKISADTTVYFPEKFVSSYKTLSVDSNKRLVRGEQILPDGIYIFVLKHNNFLVTSKQTEGKHGRIHHSSLVSGRPVDSAGFMRVEPEPLTPGTRSVTLTNESGHYKPAPADLDAALRWFKTNKVLIEVLSDKVGPGPGPGHFGSNLRTIKFTVPEKYRQK